MSNVIAFRVDRRAASRLPLPGRAAEILLFTGIRYIRDDAEPYTLPVVTKATPPEPLTLATDRLLA